MFYLEKYLFDMRSRDKRGKRMNQPTDELMKQMIKFFEQTALPRIEKKILEERKKNEGWETQLEETN